MTRDDCAAIIERARRNHRPRPSKEYQQWTSEAIIACMLGVEIFLRECIIALIDRPTRSPADVEHHAAILARNLSPDRMVDFARSGAEPNALYFLAWLRCEVECVHRELDRRLSVVPQGAAVFRAAEDSSTTTLQTLLRMLRVERLTSYQPPGKEEDEDLHQLVLTRAVSCAKDLGDLSVTNWRPPARIEFPSPPGVRFPPLDPQRWDRPSQRVEAFVARVAQLLPVLRGELETLASKAHQWLRDHYEKRTARKRAGEEVEYDEDDIGQPEKVGERIDTIREARRLYRHAQARWGAKGAAFLRALSEDSSVSGASETAGISRQTGHKYLRELELTRRKGS